MTLAQLQLACDALEACRACNRKVDTFQQNEFLMSPDDLAKEFSFLRVELSVASGKLAQLIDQVTHEGGVTPAEGEDLGLCSVCEKPLTADGFVVTPLGPRICRECAAAWQQSVANVKWGGVTP